MEFNPHMFNNNSIKNYNKFLNNEMQALNINFDNKGMMDFDNVLQKEIMAKNSVPQGPIINTGIQMNIGLENMGISPLERIDPSIQQEISHRGSQSAIEKTANDIGKAFSSGLNAVNDAENKAHEAAEIFASGGDISVHEVMLASQKANLSMQMALQLRNRLVNAYTEINNVRV